MHTEEKEQGYNKLPWCFVRAKKTDREIDAHKQVKYFYQSCWI